MLLNGYFIAFDRVVECYGIEKLKTIGDSYMCVGGLSEQNPSHPVDAVLAALEMRNIVRAFAGDSDGSHFGVRVGLHTGPVVAGVVGAREFAYDIWGETVNFSSRMESSGSPDCINISDKTYSRVKDFFLCEHRGKISTKENKEYDMYFVKGILPGLAGDGENGVPRAFQRRYKAYFRKELKHFPDLDPPA
jgi:class 3 adenylate cyclase